MLCCIQKTRVQFLPEKWQQGIGEVCFSCKSRLTQADCISLCKCYLFCHEQCFLKQFSPYITQYQEIVCIRCNEEIQLELSFYHKCEMNMTLRKAIPIAIGLVCIIVMLILVGVGVFRSGFSDGVGYGVFITLLVLMILAILIGMRRRYIDLEKTGVVNTGLCGSSQTYNSGEDKKKGKNNKGYVNDLGKGTTFELGSANHSEKDFDIQ